MIENDPKIIEKNNNSNSKLSKRAILLIVIFVIIALTIFLIILEHFQVKKIDNFEKCSAKYPIMETYPSQCRTPDGRTFVEIVPAATKEAPAGVNESEIDSMITRVGTGMAAPGITGVTVGEKLYYVDKAGTIWLKYTIVPIPENAADPVIGIMKKVGTGDWTNIDFGTAGLGNDLPLDAKNAFGLIAGGL